MDFGSGLWDNGPIGIPYNIVSGALTTKYPVDFYYPDESDAGPYPIPTNPKIEWGGDHHILTIDTDNCTLYEIYDASSQASGTQWFGGSGAIWDLNSNALRPDTWTSADAAGLPIFPGLIRYDEILAGEINHAIRFTTNCTANYYLWPARHVAQSGSCTNPVPFGARFRLKANYDISGFAPEMQIILQAMKTYGIVMADNGSPWYISGAPDENWDNDMLHTLDVLTGNNFEAVDTSSLIVNPDTAETPYHSWPTVSSITRVNANPNNSSLIDYTVTFSEPVTGVDSTDFSLTTSGASSAAVSGISGTGSSYTVTVNTGTGDGAIRLDLTDDDSIIDVDTNPLGGPDANNGNFTNGEIYAIDKTVPSVLSLDRMSTSTTSAMTVKFLLTFSENVTSVDANDFVISAAGITGASIINISGSNSTRTITVNTGIGDGTLRLDLADNDSILDNAGNPLGGAGAGNGSFISTATYNIDKPNLPAPILIFPRTNLTTNSNIPSFSWSQIAGITSYEISFATNSNFSSTVDSQIVSGNSYTTLTPLADGKYFWHVRAITPSAQTGRWSVTRVFTVDTTPPSAPVLISPANTSILRRTPTFKWKKSNTAVTYEFQYDDNSIFSSPNYTALRNNLSLTPPVMQNGIYYWHVRAKDAYGNWSTWSSPFTITIINP